ncbi:MAG: OsmC family protein [Aigarchaeota archaeon]|nr:OsmC family protein [Aigarchaeota archaeon]
MKARAVWICGYRSAVDNCRGHSVIVDLPPDYKGEDTGPTALELAVMALAGCMATIFKMVADKRKLEYSDLVLEIEAEKGEKTIEKCKGILSICTKADMSEVEKTLKSTLEVCPVGILFDRAGVKMEWEIKVESP